MIEIWMKFHLVRYNGCDIVDLQCPNLLTQKIQILIVLHLVMARVTLHRRFTIGTEQNK